MNNHKNRVGGWSFFFVVLIFGLILAFVGYGVGGGASVRIPLTDMNLSAGGALGKKEIARTALPNYLQNRIAENISFFNQSHTVTIWLAEGVGVIVIANQPQAPLIDFNVNLKR